MIDPQDVKKMIENAIPEATVDVEDPFNDQTHLRAIIKSPTFKGHGRIAQHRMVYAALGDAFEGPLHALQIVTKETE
mgnify:CR=1 FL=1